MGTDPLQEGKTFHFPCPACKLGCDRFVVWPPDSAKLTGTFFCRRCGVKGDGIEFCRQFLGLSYVDACDLLKVENRRTRYGMIPSTKKQELPLVPVPSKSWRRQGTMHLKAFMEQLKIDSHAQALLTKRGITFDTAQTFSLGYNDKERWESMEAWGLPREVKTNGKERKIWLPRGLVTPRFDPHHEGLVGIKIRREDWKKGEKCPKYVEVVGSANVMGIYGDIRNKTVVILESEFDAIVVQQQAGDLCFSVSLGGAGTKRLDLITNELIRGCSNILLAFDHDAAGQSEIA